MANSLNKQITLLIKKHLNELATLSIQDKGHISWNTLNPIGNSFYTDAVDINLYDGLAGIGLTYLYAGKILKIKRFESIATQCYHAILLELKTRNQDSLLKQGCGFAGLGGLIYSLSKYYAVYPLPSTLNAINALLKYLPVAIKQDTVLDIMYGSAGCLAALLTAQEILPTKINLQKLQQQCIQHILRYYPEPDKFPNREAAETSSKPLIGYSHGVSGILWVMTKYNRNHSTAKVDEWINKAKQYEQKFYNAKIKNWPDFRLINSSRFTMTAWCHGASGIGLSRLDIVDNQSPEELRLIKNAYTRTKQYGFKHGLSLCHGCFGNFGFEHDMFLHEMISKQEVEVTLHMIVKRLQKSGSINQFSAEPYSMPSLMLGSCGYIYILLRWLQPKIVKQILLLQ